MFEVATAALRALVELPAADRPDVCWPERYWDGWEWPRNGGIETDHVDVILRLQVRGDLVVEPPVESPFVTDPGWRLVFHSPRYR